MVRLTKSSVTSLKRVRGLPWKERSVEVDGSGERLSRLFLMDSILFLQKSRKRFGRSIKGRTNVHWTNVSPYLNNFILKNGILFSQRNCVILMALSYLVDLPCTFLSIIFCVDSNATLLALNNADNKFRSDIIFEIKYMIHCLLAKGAIADLYWVLSLTVDYLVMTE